MARARGLEGEKDRANLYAFGNRAMLVEPCEVQMSVRLWLGFG